MSIEDQKKEAQDRNELMDHLIKLIESDDDRYSFIISYANTLNIYDKEKEIQYELHINKVEHEISQTRQQLINKGMFLI